LSTSFPLMLNETCLENTFRAGCRHLTRRGLAQVLNNGLIHARFQSFLTAFEDKAPR
jgi:hypothetical protein